MVMRRVSSYEGKPVPDDQIASEDKKSIGSVGNGSDNVQHDSRLDKMIHWILDIRWGGVEFLEKLEHSHLITSV